MTPIPYVPHENWGYCKVCGEWDDRRYGSCFNCADFVMSDEVYAWDIRKPDIKWIILES